MNTNNTESTNTETTIETPAKRGGRKPNINLKIPVSALATLNKASDLTPFSILGKMTVKDETKAVPRNPKDIAADYSALADGADVQSVKLVEYVGNQIFVEDLLIEGPNGRGLKINTGLDIDFDKDCVDVVLQEVVKGATARFQEALTQHLMKVAVQPDESEIPA